MKRLIVVDVSSFIFRAFFAIRPMHTPKGVPVNAVYGTLTMLLKLINQYKPTHFFIARDTAGGSFRNELYDLYKANRSEAPEELIPQFPLIEELIDLMKMPHRDYNNYEADDVIGSIVTQFKNDFDEILIASGDKDLMQFIDGPIKMLDTMKDKIYDREGVKEKMGVFPEQIVDYLTLLGDSSDNIPGVKGIGAKGAQKLLEEYKTLDEVFKNVENVSNKRAKTALLEGGEMAELSKKLITIETKLDLKLTVEELGYDLQPSEELSQFLGELNFKSLQNKINNGAIDTEVKPVLLDYKVIKEFKDFEKLKGLLEGEDQISFEAFFKEDGSYHFADPYAVSISTVEKNYILYFENYSYQNLIEFLGEVEDLKIISSHSKTLYCAQMRFKHKNEFDVFDLTQAHFVLNPDQKHDMNTISLEFQNLSVATLKELYKEPLDQEASIKHFETELCKRASFGLKSYPIMFRNIIRDNLQTPFNEVDMKLMPVLAAMESEGVILNCDFYAELEKEFEKELISIQEKITNAGGEDVNLRSPKQVSTLLFEKLGLPIIKKTKTGASTDSDVLTKLDQMNLSEIPGLILKNREIEKLQSTYIKTFPNLVNAETKKIHTHFLQHVAATGRLSSENPNLQNIPIRTENGRRLRQGFEAAPGNLFVGADYSQVELRILAHFSEDEVMMNAFNNDEDIHAQTACEVFGVEKASREERSFAKAINFGLMYGQSSFGLSQTLNIPQKEAKEYITKYFTRFSKVKSYLDSLKETCEETGYCETIIGRKRFVPDIHADNRQVKAMAERIAINSPIQGTAADIIKMAMIKIQNELKHRGLKAKMILQVHDELIFEVPEAFANEVKDLVVSNMESIVDLKVPLKVDAGIGRNWFELK